MSIMGDKIHRIRDFRGMTQKQLGIAVGFDEKSADVRIAQYESGTRTPKQALVERLAEVLDINIKNFVSLRKNTPPIQITELRRLTEIFPNPYDELALDPTFEHDKHEADTQEVNKVNEKKFSVLQRYVKLNLVVPVGEEHMYYAAINRKSCKLTAQGQHYWSLVNKNTI